MTGGNVGTRSYAPPECGAFSRFKVGTHTDIFSAAKVLWSVITSKRVFDSHSIEDHTSMRSMFPNKEETWHLRRIFEKTIQEDPSDRFTTTEMVLHMIREVRHVVNGGYSPIETVALRCPSCGIRNIVSRNNRQHLFDQFTARNYWMSECQECGFIIVRRLKRNDNM